MAMIAGAKGYRNMVWGNPNVKAATMFGTALAADLFDGGWRVGWDKEARMVLYSNDRYPDSPEMRIFFVNFDKDKMIGPRFDAYGYEAQYYNDRKTKEWTAEVQKRIIEKRQ